VAVEEDLRRGGRISSESGAEGVEDLHDKTVRLWAVDRHLPCRAAVMNVETGDSGKGVREGERVLFVLNPDREGLLDPLASVDGHGVSSCTQVADLVIYDSRHAISESFLNIRD
jgi:hypothetical protein